MTAGEGVRGGAGVRHNLSTVISFEVLRTLKRRSFWVMSLSIPVLLVLLSLLMVFSNRSAQESEAVTGATPVAFTYSDASGLVDPRVAKAAGGTPAPDAAAARADVISGRSELFIAYPADPARQPVEVVGRDWGLTGGPNYRLLANTVLTESVRSAVADPRVATILTSGAATEVTTYRDGHVAPGWASVIPPAAFIALFYLAIIMLGNQMLNITVEEKENRVTEMILTTIHPTALIVGKILALLIVGLVQAVVLLVPALLVPAVLGGPGSSLPAVPPGTIPSMAELAAAFDPARTALAAVLFGGSFLLFTALLVAIGAIMPTAKEAGSAFGAVVIALFLPFYAGGLIVAEPHGPVSQAMTFFPITAPMTAMLRNAVGVLDPWEAAVVVAVVYGFAGALMVLGVRLFRTGSISYDQRLDVRKILRRSRM